MYDTCVCSTVYINNTGREGRRARSEPGGTRWRTGGEVKGKLANGVDSQYSHTPSERGLSVLLPLMRTPRLPAVD